MSVLYAILMGIVQGITEFLPVSSSGHVFAIEHLFNIQRGPGVLFEVMLHLGTLAAVFLVFRKDLLRILEELIGMAMDLVGNANLYIHNRRTGERLHYTKIVNSNYRKLTVLLLVSMIPTVCLGYTARRLVIKSAISAIIPGIGMLLTGIVLLVVDFSRVGGRISSRDADYSHAMWIGICQGISVFPGISRSGLTICAAQLCGFSRTFAVKYSYLLSVPAIIGAMIMELQGFVSPTTTVGMGFTCILGMLVSGAVSVFTIRFLLKLVQKLKFRYFAYYCFAAGVLTLVMNYA